jgi:hypothetical protein
MAVRRLMSRDWNETQLLNEVIVPDLANFEKFRWTW